MSLFEILAMHSAEAKSGSGLTTGSAEQRRNMFFRVMKSPNRYEQQVEDSQQKIVMISILEVVYNNIVSQLVYMRDITQFISKPPVDKIEEEAKEQNSSASDIVCKALLDEPNSTLDRLSNQLSTMNLKPLQ